MGRQFPVRTMEEELEHHIMQSSPSWQRNARRRAGERIVEVWRRDVDGAVLHCKEEPHFAMPEQWKLLYIIVVKLRTGL